MRNDLMKATHQSDNMVYSTGTRCLILFFVLFIEQSAYKEYNLLSMTFLFNILRTELKFSHGILSACLILFYLNMSCSVQ